MPEEWAEVGSLCGAAVRDLFTESPVCCTCLKMLQQQQKRACVALIVNFSSPLVTLLSFLTHAYYLPLWVDPFGLILSFLSLLSHSLLLFLSFTRGTGQRLPAGFAKAFLCFLS